MTTTETQLQRAQAKRERKANRKGASNYAKYNVTDEGNTFRESVNQRVAEARAEREARRAAREAEENEEALAEDEDEGVTIATPGIVSCDEGCGHDH